MDPSEAKEAVARMLDDLRAYNQAAEEGKPPAGMARPGPDACRFCDFKAVCRPFYDAVAPDWGWYLRCVVGEVGPIDETVPRVRITAEAGNVTEGDCYVLGLSGGDLPQAGDTVAIVDALPTPAERDIRVTWESTIERW